MKTNKDNEVNSEVVEATKEFIKECFPGLDCEETEKVMKHLKETNLILVDEWIQNKPL